MTRRGSSEMVDVFFADDSKQRSPTRSGVNSLVSIGGIYVPSAQVLALETTLGEVCHRHGFPSPQEPFKWSPNRGHWFRDGVADRAAFFVELIETASNHSVKAIVMVEDESCRTATGQTDDHEFDALTLFMERAQYILERQQSTGIVVVAEPSGGNREEQQLLTKCHDLFHSGTDYTDLSRLAFSVVTAPFKNVRCLQLADIVVSATTALIAGNQHAGPIVEVLKGLYYRENDCIGGRGVKISPDFRYLNLYHWLLGDTHYWRFNAGYPLPLQDRPYRENGDAPYPGPDEELFEGLNGSAEEG